MPPASAPAPAGPDDAHRSGATRRAVLRAALLPLAPALLWRGTPAAAATASPSAAPSAAATGAPSAAATATPTASPSAAASATPVRIVFDVQDNPPLICGTGAAIDPVKPGTTIELLRMAAERAHVPITLSRTPWERGLYLIQAGEADAIFASSYVTSRLRYGVYPMKDGHPDTARKLFDQSYRLYVRAGSGVRWDGKTLSNLHAPVGATTGTRWWQSCVRWGWR